MWTSVHDAANASACHREAAVRPAPATQVPAVCRMHAHFAPTTQDLLPRAAGTCRRGGLWARGAGWGQALGWQMASPHTCPPPRCHSRAGAVHVVTRHPPPHVQMCAPRNSHSPEERHVSREAQRVPTGLPWGPCSALIAFPRPGRGRTLRDGSQSPCCLQNQRVGSRQPKP